jgi:hypothetical protein
MFEQQNQTIDQSKINSIKTELESFCRNEINKLKREIMNGESGDVSTKREQLPSELLRDLKLNNEPTTPKAPEFNFVFEACFEGQPRRFAVVAELLE